MIKLLRTMLFPPALFVFWDGLGARGAPQGCQTLCRRLPKVLPSVGGLETKGLENCMHKHGDRLTSACVTALVRTGQVSQAQVDRRKKQLGR